MTQGPDQEPIQNRSLLVNLFEKHFWRCYLVLVTVLVVLIVFGVTTGEHVPLWAALGTAITSVVALHHREQRRRNARR